MIHRATVPRRAAGGRRARPRSGSMTGSVEVLRGTLDLMILQAVRGGPEHGFGISRWIRQHSGDVLDVDDGALYPALHRLVERGWIVPAWGVTENNRRARYYSLTEAGRSQLDV